MTALLRRPALDASAWTIGAPRLLAGLQASERLGLGAHLAVHSPLPGSDLNKIVAHLDVSGLAGRGGRASRSRPSCAPWRPAHVT